MSSSVTIKAVQGDTLGPVVFGFKDTDGNAFDLTGSTLTIAIKTALGQVEYVTGVDAALTIADPTSGQATLKLSPDQTEPLLVGPNSTFRVRRDFGGDVQTLLFGVFDTERGGL